MCFCTGCLSMAVHLVNLSSQEFCRFCTELVHNNVSKPICRRWLRWWLCWSGLWISEIIKSSLSLRKPDHLTTHIVWSLAFTSLTISDNYDSYKTRCMMIPHTWGGTQGLETAACMSFWLRRELKESQSPSLECNALFIFLSQVILSSLTLSTS